MQVWSLVPEDPLEEKMATYSNILAWEIQWTEGAEEGYSPWGGKELDITEQLNNKKNLFSRFLSLKWNLQLFNPFSIPPIYLKNL